MRQHRRARSATNPELVVYVFEVLLHRARADRQDRSDFSVGLAIRDQPEDLLLPSLGIAR